MRSLTGNSFSEGRLYYKGAPERIQNVIKVLVYTLLPVSKVYFFKVCEKQGLGIKEKKELWNEFTNSGYLFPYTYYKKVSYHLQWDILNGFLIEVLDTHEADNPFYQDLKSEIAENADYHKWESPTLVKGYLFLSNLLFENKITPLDLDDLEIFNTIWLIIAKWIYIDELQPYALRMPHRVLELYYSKLIDKMSYNLNCDLSVFKQLKDLVGSDVFYSACALLPETIYSGDFKSLGNRELTSAESYYAQAFLSFSKGDLENVVKQFEIGLKEDDLKDFSSYPFYDFMYVSAMMQLDTPKYKRKLLTLSKRKKLKEEPEIFKATHLLLCIATTINISDLEVVDTSNYQALFPITQLLYCITLQHYHLAPLKEETKRQLDYIMDYRGIDYLKYLVANEFEGYSHMTCGLSFDTHPLLPAYKALPLWENTITYLLSKSIVQGKPEKPVETKLQTSRFIYLVDNYLRVTPKLQKSKDGIKWTKGRVVALSTFAEGMPEMTDFDKEMSLLVKHERSQSYFGYASDYYYLNGQDVAKKLIGYPFVYLEANQDIAVSITQEYPYLSIEKHNDKFRVSTNVSSPELHSSYEIQNDGNTRFKLIEISTRQREILGMLMRVGEFPLSSKNKLIELVEALSSEITIHTDLVATNTDVEKRDADASVIVQLYPVGSGFKAECFVKPLIDTPPYCKPGIGSKTVMGEIEGRSCQAYRDMAAELTNIRQFERDSSMYDFDENYSVQLETAEECLAFLNLMNTLDYAKIEWPEGVKLKVKGRIGLTNLSLTLKNKNSWFEMVGELRYNDDTILALEDILQQIKQEKGRKFIALKNDEYLALSDDLRKVISSIQSVADENKKGVFRVSEFSVPLFKLFEGEGVNMKVDAHFRKLVKRIEQAEKQKIEVPALLQASLREYQEEGFRWMVKLKEWGSGACLADDMGLGKTVQATAMLLHQATLGPALVVAPTSVVYNWKSELLKFAPALNVVILNTESDRSQVIDSAADYDVILTTYGLLTLEEKLLQKEWATVVLDEAHTIKNKETKMSKAAMELNSGFRLLLTGTPIQNHLSEIWNLFQFMNPGMLGSFEQFTNRFITPIEIDKNTEKQQDLKKFLNPFILRRTKNEVLDELPGKTEIVLPVELSSKEELIYESMRQRIETAIKEETNNTVQTLAEITRLRQAASHMALVDESFKDNSSKMTVFFDLYEEMKENNHRALVFSQFTSHLALLKKELDRKGIEYLYLDGSTPVTERNKLVKKFQTEQQPLFLISLKAGGLGLNLTAADFVVHLDPWWNPAIEDQASDRAYRIGQKRPVTVYRLIASNTIEEKIIELHKTKKDLADGLLEGTNLSHKLTKDDLLNLLTK